MCAKDYKAEIMPLKSLDSLDSQPLNALLVDHSAGAHGHMVTLGENPGIEVRRHIL